MKVTLTKEDIEAALYSYDSGMGRMESCPLAQALKREGLDRVAVSFIDVQYTSPVDSKTYERDMTEQAVDFADEFDDWYDYKRIEGQLGNFAGRTITVWEE